MALKEEAAGWREDRGRLKGAERRENERATRRRMWKGAEGSV